MYIVFTWCILISAKVILFWEGLKTNNIMIERKRCRVGFKVGFKTITKVSQSSVIFENRLDLHKLVRQGELSSEISMKWSFHLVNKNEN